MTEQRYIVMTNWDRFQHYKDRTPRWIKNYTELMADQAYLSLSFRRRGILHGLWLLYAASRLNLGCNLAQLGRMLGDETVRMRDLESLNEAGFLEFSLAPRYQNASLDLEVELEKKELAFKAKNGARANGREHRPYDPPRDPVALIRALIGRTIHDHVDLEAELAAFGINGVQADELRALVPAVPRVPDSPDNDIPF